MPHSRGKGFQSGSAPASSGDVDEISTSDDWLLEARKDADLLRLEWKPANTVGGRLKRFMGSVMGSAVDASRQAELESRLP